jgi:hypothetical protein
MQETISPAGYQGSLETKFDSPTVNLEPPL